MLKVTPKIMLKAVKIGTKSHGIPFYIKLRKRYAFAIK
jgi:hypothetical protein